jgi:serine/threonine-protein kinase RsbW
MPSWARRVGHGHGAAIVVVLLTIAVSLSVPPVSLLIPGGPTAAHHARHAVLARLGAHLDSAAASDLNVVLSELVTNSVVHAGVGPGRYLRITVGLLDDRLLVAVSDRGSHTLPRLETGTAEDAKGLGLRIVDGLARSWGVARDGTGRTQVWCELALRESGG